MLKPACQLFGVGAGMSDQTGCAGDFYPPGGPGIHYPTLGVWATAVMPMLLPVPVMAFHPARYRRAGRA